MERNIRVSVPDGRGDYAAAGVAIAAAHRTGDCVTLDYKGVTVEVQPADDSAVVIRRIENEIKRTAGSRACEKRIGSVGTVVLKATAGLHPEYAAKLAIRLADAAATEVVHVDYGNGRVVLVTPGDYVLRIVAAYYDGDVKEQEAPKAAQPPVADSGIVYRDDALAFVDAACRALKIAGGAQTKILFVYRSIELPVWPGGQLSALVEDYLAKFAKAWQGEVDEARSGRLPAAAPSAEAREPRESLIAALEALADRWSSVGDPAYASLMAVCTGLRARDEGRLAAVLDAYASPFYSSWRNNHPVVGS